MVTSCKVHPVNGLWLQNQAQRLRSHQQGWCRQPPPHPELSRPWHQRRKANPTRPAGAGTTQVSPRREGTANLHWFFTPDSLRASKPVGQIGTTGDLVALRPSQERKLTRWQVAGWPARTRFPGPAIPLSRLSGATHVLLLGLPVCSLQHGEEQ